MYEILKFQSRLHSEVDLVLIETLASHFSSTAFSFNQEFLIPYVKKLASDLPKVMSFNAVNVLELEGMFTAECVDAS